MIKILRNLFKNSQINFMNYRKLAIYFSIISMLFSLILVFFKGLNLGIDFAGGILIEVELPSNNNINDLRNVLSSKFSDVQIQNVDNSAFLIKMPLVNQEQNFLVKNIQQTLQENFTQIQYRKIDYVGPQVGSELILKGLLALILSFVAIMIYITIRFDWQFGIGGIFALLHDAIVVLGFFAITGLEFNLTSIACILTVIGYSINDSVVIYDRIRENLKKHPKINLNDLINTSINSTLSRTILTASTTLISLLALIIYGGDVLFSFSVATFFGIALGTYSSIYISAPILFYFDPRSKKQEV
ncbi:MAG: protein translocase subunit SecF [Proteobacteria bacterium]|jgi:preprotein translocase SecF subunit|nr:protein translocase subunit SecF [Pseudomonadota bacterium]